MVTKKKKIDWVIIDSTDLFCRRCGAREKVFPMRLTKSSGAYLQELQVAFERDHSRCELTATSPEVLQGRSPQDWLRGGDTGTSSITICRVLSGYGDETRVGWPYDPSDFGRCHRLLELFPGWRERLGEVARAYPGTPWVPLVREWDRLTALWEEESPSGKAPKLWALMQELRAEGGAP